MDGKELKELQAKYVGNKVGHFAMGECVVSQLNQEGTAVKLEIKTEKGYGISKDWYTLDTIKLVKEK